MLFIQSNISSREIKSHVQKNILCVVNTQSENETQVKISQKTVLAEDPAIKTIRLVFSASLLGFIPFSSLSFAAENETVNGLLETQSEVAQLPSIKMTAQEDGQRQLLYLNQISHVGSGLKLTAKETPATVETYTQEQMQQKGLRTVKDAFANITGAIVGNVPGNPAVLSMRGFSDSAVSVLQDGIRISDSTMMMRDLDSWKYEKIEVLKGPASVLYGLGSLGGTVNMITRKPSLDGDETDGMLSYGSFNTVRAAISTNQKLDESTALLLQASYSDSDSLYDIDHQDTKKVSVGSGLLYQPNDDLSMLFSVDHDYDKADSTYQGSPLLPASVAKRPGNILKSADGLVLDKSLRHINYNPEGAYSSSESTTVNWKTDYKLTPNWTLNNVMTYFKATRDFFEAPDQNYDKDLKLFKRNVERITHNHEFWSNRLSLSNDVNLFGKYRNRLSIGTEYNHTNLTSLRQFADFTDVDPFAPDVGIMPSGGDPIWGKDNEGSSNSVHKSKVDTIAVFAEDAFNLTPDWLIVGGARFEHLDAKRDVINLHNNNTEKFNPTFNPVSWRLGTIYNINPDIQIYGQYSTAVTPVNSLLLISSDDSDFKLSKGKSAELGFKTSLFGGKTDVIGSIYWIELNDILTQDPKNTLLTVQGGSQTSRGAELTASTMITPQLRADLGLAWVDAKYHGLIEDNGADRSGNRPVNVPKHVANASVNYKFNSVPVSLTAYGKYVGGFYTDTANSYFVKGHATLDASISYALKNMTFTLWGRNLSNEYYGEYSGYSPTQIFIGAPRSVELAMTFKY
ncbi:TonB-dependent receptor [Acinetobacter stercoris]|uniref:Putative TonB-dependent receptor BfrD n=1 Tax=Acinetobacter stercoris TaxID=2126983 RepID=A0A2U3MWA5_9GAMM|nr:TonB-dependent receptor [Acinetobacter stercoris]SPL69717.1 putative TonB-dependent receptor BfrD precursor [Acinetobacter stercoris]